jgi:hypothetical protein
LVQWLLLAAVVSVSDKWMLTLNNVLVVITCVATNLWFPSFFYAVLLWLLRKKSELFLDDFGCFCCCLQQSCQVPFLLQLWKQFHSCVLPFSSFVLSSGLICVVVLDRRTRACCFRFHEISFSKFANVNEHCEIWNCHHNSFSLSLCSLNNNKSTHIFIKPKL